MGKGSAPLVEGESAGRRGVKGGSGGKPSDLGFRAGGMGCGERCDKAAPRGRRAYRTADRTAFRSEVSAGQTAYRCYRPYRSQPAYFTMVVGRPPVGFWKRV
ncbi:hypothetical protein GCM10017688_53070 [Streptomyces ramulosus]